MIPSPKPLKPTGRGWEVLTCWWALPVRLGFPKLTEDGSLVLLFVQHLCAVLLEGRRDSVRLIGFEKQQVMTGAQKGGFMQEEVDQKTVALSIRTTKLTGKVLAAALGKVVRALQKHHPSAMRPRWEPNESRCFSARPGCPRQAFRQRTPASGCPPGSFPHTMRRSTIC